MIQQLALGAYHSCGLATNGNLYCWGEPPPLFPPLKSSTHSVQSLTQDLISLRLQRLTASSD